MTRTASIEVLEQGAVTTREPGSETAVATGPRCATVGDELVCTFVVQPALGANRFTPMITRSTDSGRTWHGERMIWPEQRERWSIYGALGAGRDGELTFFGTRYPVGEPGASFWCDATQGLLQNELIWSRSLDGGRTWAAPTVIPMQIPGAAEVPSPMLVTDGGRRLGPYGPYNTFDPALKVDREQAVLMISDDDGHAWNYQPMMRFTEAGTGAAGACLTELADGRLLGACWQVDFADRREFENPYALSHDGGRTWRGPYRTGIRGQAAGLAALPDGRALMVYNQRKHGVVGVYLALADPRGEAFNVHANQIVWRARTATQQGDSADHQAWVNFAFGEPAVHVLPDGEALVTLWCAQPDFQGIRWVRVRVDA